MKKIFCAVLTVSSVFVLAACNGNSNSKAKDDNNKAAVENPSKKESKEDKDPSLLKNNEKFAKLALSPDAEKSKIVEEKEYQANWSDDSWSGVKISIDNISILKLSDFTGFTKEKYEGFIMVHFLIDNKERDLKINPEYAKLNTNLGQQTQGYIGFEPFAGDLMKASKVDGYAAFPLKKLEKVDEITQLRLKFDGYYDTDDYKDKNARHEYDITIDLK